MLDKLTSLDQELFIYLNGLGVDSWDAFWMFYTTKFNWIPFYAFLLYLLFKHKNLRPFLVTIVSIALMITFTDQVTNLFKGGFMRLRPCHEADVAEVMRLVKASCGGRHGFFSGHSSNSMALAIFIGLTLKRAYKFLFPFMILWALLMAYSRIYVGVHYPLDVFCGALFGVFSGWLWFTICKYLNLKLVK
jgi:undecaprenyl-diphosphatase